MPLSFYIVYLPAQMMQIERESVWAKEKLQRPGACVVLGRPRKLWLLSLCFSFPCWKEGAIIFPCRSVVKMHVFRLCGALGINNKISYSVWMCGLNKACKPLCRKKSHLLLQNCCMIFCYFEIFEATRWLLDGLPSEVKFFYLMFLFFFNAKIYYNFQRERKMLFTGSLYNVIIYIIKA